MSDYIPPPVAWRLPLFVEATHEELRARQVDCPRCPVYMQCEAGEGGTGWVCPTCGATGVSIEKVDENTFPPDLLIIDCGAHKFNRRPDAKNMTICSLCSGGQMELEMRFPDARVHLISSVHAKIPVESRQKFLQEKRDFWAAEYTKDATK